MSHSTSKFFKGEGSRSMYICAFKSSFNARNHVVSKVKLVFMCILLNCLNSIYCSQSRVWFSHIFYRFTASIFTIQFSPRVTNLHGG